MKKIMIRADDLGYSEAVNYGICKTVRDGIIKNAGFMVNMPASQHGFDLIKDCDVCLGQHTNVCVGRPLSDPVRIPSLVDAQGKFISSKVHRSTDRDLIEIEEAVIEIEAQYERFKEITGREPSYFEAHAIESNHLQEAIELVAVRHGLKFQGVNFNGPTVVNGKKIYFNMHCFDEDYDPERTFQNVYHNAHEDGYEMIVFHPGYLDAAILNTSTLTIPRTKEVEAACSPSLKQFIKENNIRLFTYDEI